MSLSAIEALREHVHCLETHWRQRVLGSSGILVVACEDPGCCPLCQGPMRVQKTFLHSGKTIKHGAFQVRETVHVCRAQCCHPSGALVTHRATSVTRHIMPASTVGYDVMVFVGMQRFLHHRQREEIRNALLSEHGVDLAAGEVSNLSKRFLQYLETLHEVHIDQIREVLTTDGGYPLHIDASGENGQGTLLVALAGWRDWVLDAWKIPTECAEVIVAALRSVADRFGPPCAVMRDLGKAMIPAVNDFADQLDQEVRVLACHLHFLRDIGKDLLNPSYSELRALFRHYKIRPNLGALARDLGRKLGTDIRIARQEVGTWQEKHDDGHVLPEGRPGLAVVRALAQWILDYAADGSDQGFPFDRPYLDFHARCVIARRAVDAFLRTPPKDRRVRSAVERLRRCLEPVRYEVSFGLVADKLRKRAELFDKLRDALRLVPKSGGRNTSPSQPLQLKEVVAELVDIQANVETFVASLHERRPERGPAQDLREAVDIILDHIETHGDSLWGHVLSLSSTAGHVIRIVDRTNNILETKFGKIKQGERRRSGRKILTQDFESLPAAAALTSNLTCPDYVALVCGSLDNLADAFAKLDSDRRKRQSAGQSLPQLGRSHNPIPELATASLPAADRPLLRSEAMRRRVLAAANSRAPRTQVEPSRRRALATAK